MTYALDRGLFIEHGPAIQAANAAATRHSARMIGWRRLDADHRLDAIERALKSPANDFIDSYPVAL
ncbi:MAG TPA: hypothetical protein VFU80_02090 [Sphingomicrobium sp.]|nr:hypothetical protein [Sphingomicrobium sp.]